MRASTAPAAAVPAHAGTPLNTLRPPQHDAVPRVRTALPQGRQADVAALPVGLVSRAGEPVVPVEPGSTAEITPAPKLEAAPAGSSADNRHTAAAPLNTAQALQQQRAALADIAVLPEAQRTARSMTVVERIEPALQAAATQSQRLTLARTAAAFLRNNSPDHGAAFARLVVLAGVCEPGAEAGAGARGDLGSLDDWRRALQHTLPYWMGKIDTAAQQSALRGQMVSTLGTAFLASMQGSNVQAGPVLRQQVIDFAQARASLPGGRLLPEGHAFLDDGHARQQAVAAAKASPATQRLFLTELTELASDLAALGPDRARHLLALADEGLSAAAGSSARGGEEDPAAADRVGLLQVLVQQLAAPPLAGSDMADAVVGLVERQMGAARSANAEQNSRLALTVADLIPALGSSRPEQALKDRLARHVADAMSRADGPDGPFLARGVARCLAALPAAGTSTDATASSPDRGRRFFAKPGKLPLLQRKDAGTLLAASLDTWRQSLVPGGDAALARSLVSVAPDLLSAAESGVVQQEWAVSVLARAALPLDCERSDAYPRYLEAALGNDPARRAQVAGTLVNLCTAKGGTPVQRQSAARCLHHLLTAWQDALPEPDVSRATEAIIVAFKGEARPGERAERPGLAAAVLKETERPDGLPTPLLAALLRQVLDDGDAGSAAAGMALLAPVYERASPSDQGALRSALLKWLPELPPRDERWRLIQADPGLRKREAAAQEIGVQLLRQLCRSDNPQPERLLALANVVLDRLHPDKEAAAVLDLFDHFDDERVTEAGQLAALEFALRLQHADLLAAAAAGAVRHVLGCDPSPARSDEVTSMAKHLLSQGLKSPEAAGNLVKQMMVGGTAVEASMWPAFLKVAPGLDGVALRRLLTAWCNSQGNFSSDERTELSSTWADVRASLAGEKGQSAGHLELLDAFLHIGRQVAGVGEAGGQAPVLSPQTIESLVDAVGQMRAKPLHVMAQMLEGAELSLQQQDEVARGLLAVVSPLQLALQKMKQAAPAAGAAASSEGPHPQQRAFELAARYSPARALESLASCVGLMPLEAGKRWTRVGWDQDIAARDGTPSDLLGELRARPLPEVLPALEALAERYASLPDGHKTQARELLAARMPGLAPEKRERLERTLALFNPDLLHDDQAIITLGCNPGGRAWQQARQRDAGSGPEALRSARDARDTLKRELKNTRFSAAATPEQAGASGRA